MEILSITGIHWDLLLSGTLGLILLLTALYIAVVPQGDRRWQAVAIVLGVSVLLSTQMEKVLYRLILLDFATLCAVALVWANNTSQAHRAAKTYLAFVVIAILLITSGLYMAGVLTPAKTDASSNVANNIAATLLLVGFAVKLAFIPFYFWLPEVAASTTPMTTALIVGVVDIAEFSELTLLRVEAPWVFEQHQAIWLALALVTMFGGALLALAQNDLKRMLAFSTIDDMGYLLLGLVIGSRAGFTGALIGALAHAFFKTLLFAAVGIAEYQTGNPVTLDQRGLIARFPAAGAAFIVGALGILGVPPFFGFVGRWRLYLAGAEAGGAFLALSMALATGIALLYYTRAIHRVWMGKPTIEGATCEPRLAAGVLIVMMALAIAFGLVPGLFI